MARTRTGRTQVCKRMEKKRYRTRTAVHEAAHAVYAERVGAHVSFHGPWVAYDERGYDILGGGCCVELPPEPTGVFSDFTGATRQDAIMAFAHIGVAGRIAVKRLLKKDEVTDGQDFEAYRKAATVLDANEREIIECWERAKQDVEEDFDDPEFRQQVWKRAKEAEPQLCGSESLNAPGAQPDFGFDGYSLVPA